MVSIGMMTAVQAWGDCVDGVRDATPAEKEFHAKVQRAMLELFPAAPEGFKQPAQPAVDNRLSMCKGQAIGQFSMEMQLVYARAVNVRDSQTAEYPRIQELEKKMQALKTLSPEAKANYDEMKKQYDAVNAPYRAAVKAGNKEEAARLRKDVDAAYEKMTRVEEDHRKAMQPQASEISKEIEKVRTEIRAKYQDPVMVSILVNDPYHNLEGKGWTLGTMGKPAVKVQKVVYGFRGPAEQVEKFMAAVDQAKVKALVGMQ